MFFANSLFLFFSSSCRFLCFLIERDIYWQFRCEIYVFTIFLGKTFGRKEIIYYLCNQNLIFMAFTILSAKRFATTLKATIHKTGRLGFTDDTAKALELKSGKFARFAQDDENGALYLIINNEGSEDAFSVRESSGYFYVSTKVMFDTLGFHYEQGNIMFDLVRQPSLDNDLQGQVYYMKQRPVKNTKEKKNDTIIEP